ncbi:MAG: hypothetical protein QM786_19745 [Breznakibacter sp.]
MRPSVHILLLLLMVLSICSADLFAQSNKRHKGKKRTSKREIAKKQQEAIEKQERETPFAPPRTFNPDAKDFRDDYIWKSQTAGIVYPKAGNISIIEPSKYALNPTFQLEAIFPLEYHIPNLFVKKLWYDTPDWKIASRHGLYSATNGFKWMQKRQHYSFVDSLARIPNILSVKNELIVSRAFSKTYGCSGRQPYLILTGSVGLDFGIPLGDNDLTQIDLHFFAVRSPALTAKGYTANVLARADYQINSILFTGTSLRYLFGTFSGHDAVEQKAWIEVLLQHNIGLSAGYALSLGNYGTSHNLGFIPVIDVCWYFGSKRGHQKGLFEKKMF